MSVTEPTPTVGASYRSARIRLHELLTSLEASQWELPVAACPGWRVHDVLAHLVGIVEDALAGRLTGPPAPDQTRLQVERHRDDDPNALVADWATMAPDFEDALTALDLWPAFIDVLSHEHDIRAAVRDRSFRDHGDVVLAADLLTDSLLAGVQFDLGGRIRGHPGADFDARLTASPFDVLRFRLGRRSQAQVLAMVWAGDPRPFLGALFVFGPATDDVTE